MWKNFLMTMSYDNKLPQVRESRVIKKGHLPVLPPRSFRGGDDPWFKKTRGNFRIELEEEHRPVTHNQERVKNV